MEAITIESIRQNNYDVFVTHAESRDLYTGNDTRDLNPQAMTGYPTISLTKEKALEEFDTASKLNDTTVFGVREIEVTTWKLTIGEDDLKHLDEDDLEDYILESYTNGEIIKEGTFDNNSWAPLKGGVVLTWSWHRYIGYARNFHGLDWGDDMFDFGTRKYAKTEKDIYTYNHEYTNKEVSNLVIKASDLEGMSDEEKRDYIVDEIMSDKWKWTYNSAPSENDIVNALNLKPYFEED